LIRIENGYSCCAGLAESGWYAGALVIEDVDGSHIPSTDLDYDQARESCLDWQRALAGVDRRVVCVDGNSHQQDQIARAENICGPVSPREITPGPTFAWTQRMSDAWNFGACSDGRTSTVFQDSSPIRSPGVCKGPDGLMLACETDSKGAGEVRLFSLEGDEILRIRGRNPVLRASLNGVFLLTEQVTRDSISLLLQEVGGNGSEVEISGEEDYTFNADMVCGENGVFIVAETGPAFGMDERLGMHRDLRAWRWSGGSLEDISGNGGRLPIDREAFYYWSNENMPPMRPTIFLDDVRPVVAFRRFRHFAFKTFGWDTCMIRWNDTWGITQRLSEGLTAPDTGYAVLPFDGKFLGVFPCLDNPGNHTPCTNFRVEVREFDPDFSLPHVEVPEDKRADYMVTTGYRNVAPDPPELEEPYGGRTLIWGDLHSHTNYSKCMSAMDGCPDEVFRYARDVLGCRVFTFMDHDNMLGGPEAAWLGDRLEVLAGGWGIPLYGYESGQSPGRHTNFYARDRDTYDGLRCVLGSQGRYRNRTYRQLVEDFPLDSALALRHFHGNMAEEDHLVQSFEAQLEVAMESMQGRNNNLLVTEGRFTLFPNQFLDAGLKVGLVGGSDHFRARGPNHFCMTGFWVREPTAEGVFEALRNRYTIAMSDSRVSMAARMKGQPAGRSVTVESGEGVRIRLSVSCGHTITRAALIRDGTVMRPVEVGEKRATVELVDSDPSPGRHWYVPTVEVETAYGEGNRGYGHTSPFFVMVREPDAEK